MRHTCWPLAGLGPLMVGPHGFSSVYGSSHLRSSMLGLADSLYVAVHEDRTVWQVPQRRRSVATARERERGRKTDVDVESESPLFCMCVYTHICI